ncbi:MAG: repeat-containing protein [Planctomycetaceae bacterium]|nr:repeat-containing protein [Planctomycetaceae bacterium]
MHRLLRLTVLLLFAGGSTFAADKPVTYDEQIRPILKQYCFKCHGEDQQKADLNLSAFRSVVKGGSAGKVVIAGRASASLLFQAITNEDAAARMPPNNPPLPAEKIELIRAWIQDGLRESSGSKSLGTARDLSFKPSAGVMVKPDGPPPMPVNLPEIAVPPTVRPMPVISMAASPWAPLLAVSGYEHIRLIDLATQKPIGVLPFPEGEPQVLRFSRDGKVLMAAGGRPVQSGKVVLYDIQSGKQLAAIGDEIDAVLAADLSPDQKLVALGGSGRVVKVFSTEDGSLKYKISKHTDWITALAFSHDGKQLATADRAGGIHLWDANSGAILLSLAEHKQAVRTLSWRSDSQMLASGSEDGLLVWWNTSDGWPAISKGNAHPPARKPGVYGKLPNGVLSAVFDPQGQLFSVGRDRLARLWDAGGNQVKTFDVSNAIPIQAAISFDGKLLIAGDSVGMLHYWPAGKP